MSEQIRRTSSGFILYDDALLGHAGEELFERRYWQDRGAVQDAAGGRGGTFLIKAPGADWVVRHYRRGGAVARFNRDRYLWTGLERTRPWREWKLLAALCAEGLPVPQPVAARVRIAALLYKGDLITRRIPGARSLAEMLQGGGAVNIPWAAVGACIRRFHDAGVWHADLNAHNILVDERGGVHLIDFDRGCRRDAARTWKYANLSRLDRSLRKLSPDRKRLDSGWNEFLKAYQA